MKIVPTIAIPIISAVLCFALMIVSGCEQPSTPLSNSAPRVTCLNGINYYKWREQAGYGGYGFLAPVYNTDGHVQLCNGSSAGSDVQ